MKITGLETFVVDAGWRPWQFVAVRTDAGLTGYGECSDARNPYGVVSTVHDFEAILLGQDPRPVENTTVTSPRCTRPTCAPACPTSESWRSTSTTCRGRTSWSTTRP